MHSESRPRRDILDTFFPWLTLGLSAIIVANVLSFIYLASNPLVRSDGWYFLDVLVRKAVNGTLVFSDLFVKQSQLDHAQPLRRLVC